MTIALILILILAALGVAAWLAVLHEREGGGESDLGVIDDQGKQAHGKPFEEMLR